MFVQVQITLSQKTQVSMGNHEKFLFPLKELVSLKSFSQNYLPAPGSFLWFSPAIPFSFFLQYPFCLWSFHHLMYPIQS